jgi:hypothetical protein
MVVREYKLGDVYKVEWKEPLLAGADQQLRDQKSFTLLLDDKIVAIMSFVEVWDSCGFVMMYISDVIKGHGLSLVKEVRTALKIAVAFHNTRKVYAVIDSNRKGLKRWIELFGFTPEYAMIKAGPDGQDMLGYSRTYEVVGTDYPKKEE